MAEELPNVEYYQKLHSLQYQLKIADLQRDRNYWYNLCTGCFIGFVAWNSFQFNGYAAGVLAFAWSFFKFWGDTPNVKRAQTALDYFENNYAPLTEGFY